MSDNREARMSDREIYELMTLQEEAAILLHLADTERKYHVLHDLYRVFETTARIVSRRVSGSKTPAPDLEEIKEHITKILGHENAMVLFNRVEKSVQAAFGPLEGEACSGADT